MVKPRSFVRRRANDPRPGFVGLNISSMHIIAWCPDDEAQEPPEQVHLVHQIEGLDIPLVTRYKSPDTLGFLIEELARYRRHVWPEAEPVNCEAEKEGEK